METVRMGLASTAVALTTLLLLLVQLQHDAPAGLFA